MVTNLFKIQSLKQLIFNSQKIDYKGHKDYNIQAFKSNDYEAEYPLTKLDPKMKEILGLRNIS